MKMHATFVLALFAVVKSETVNPALHELLVNAEESGISTDELYINRHSWPTPLMISNAGYPSEVHTVQTDDCYVLEMHRIPHGKNETPEQAKKMNKKSILLQHGLLCSSADWVMTEPDKALGFLLADAGYDVWLGNFRGNTYSRKHCSLNPANVEFWKFSWDQMSEFDLPAIIDKIIAETGNQKIHYVGHSMGTTAAMAMLIKKPEMAEKLLLTNFLAPVGFMGHSKSPISYMAPYVDSVEWIAQFLGIGEFLPSNWLIDVLDNMFCNPGFTQSVCRSILFLICGFDKEQMNDTLLPTILHHDPAGASTKTIIHYIQEMNSKGFTAFDWGEDENMNLYGTPTPPAYDVGAVNTPIALYWSQNDWLAQPADVIELISHLPNIVDNYEVPFEKWNHLDFLWGLDANKILYPQVMENLKKFEEHNY